MKIVQIMSLCAALGLLTLADPALAEEGWLSKLNPLASREKPAKISGERYNVSRKAEPSALEKFNAGTKKFFTGVGDALTGKKSAPKRTSGSLQAPWIRQPRYAPQQRGQSVKKKSWLDSLFGRKEPKRVESMEDWVGLPRVNP